MAEILHHLGCIKPCKHWDISHINWCRISSISSIEHGCNQRGPFSFVHDPGHPRDFACLAKIISSVSPVDARKLHPKIAENSLVLSNKLFSNLPYLWKMEPIFDGCIFFST